MKKELTFARDILENTAPLGGFDCGALCYAKCCKGDSDTGMWLFPGEEEYYSDKDGFEIKQTEGNFGYPMLVCGGKCSRKDRPLACRIYPFFPLLKKENGKIKVRPIRDIRGMSSCPILKNNKKPDRKFIRAMRLAARSLARDEELFDYLKNLGDEICEIAELRYKLNTDK